MEDWAKQPNRESAQFVALKTDQCAIKIAKNDIDGEFKFDNAQRAAAEFGDGFRNATRHESIEMYDARFVGLDEAFRIIGGIPIDGCWRWTCEQDTDPDFSSNRAFFYSGHSGNVNYTNKYCALSVRPVADLNGNSLRITHKLKH